MIFGNGFRTVCLELIFSVSAIMAASIQSTAIPVFQANSQLVLVPVTVTDRDTRLVQGLHAEDFSVFDNQTAQRIVSFGVDDAPCSVVVLVDISGSMYKALPHARALLESFLHNANPEDEFLLLTVSTQPDTVSGFTHDVAELGRNIGAARPGGMTSLIDTIHLGIAGIKKARWSRRALLILSDGYDNNSRYTERELMSEAIEADVQVYSMVFDTGLPAGGSVLLRPGLVGKPWEAARENQGPNLLQKLSEKTGGLFFHIHNDAEAGEAIDSTGGALRNEYLIGFQPSKGGLSGKWHQIQINTDVPRVHVHARNGYSSK